MDIFVRHAEPDDYEAIHWIYGGPRATAGTLQLRFQSVEFVRRRFSELPEGFYDLVACVEGEVVGHLGLEITPARAGGTWARSGWRCATTCKDGASGRRSCGRRSTWPTTGSTSRAWS